MASRINHFVQARYGPFVLDFVPEHNMDWVVYVVIVNLGDQLYHCWSRGALFLKKKKRTYKIHDSNWGKDYLS